MPPQRSWTDDVIIGIMNEYQIDPAVIGNRQRFQTVHGHGFYRCTGCARGWSSYWLWMTIDLARQRISYRFKQKCNKCQSPCVSIVNQKDFEEMVDFVCKRYLTPRPPPPPANGSDASDGTGSDAGDPVRPVRKPHVMVLCEKCGFGELGPCWVNRRRSRKSRSKKNRNPPPPQPPGNGGEGVTLANASQEQSSDNRASDELVKSKKKKKKKPKNKMVNSDVSNVEIGQGQEDGAESSKKKKKKKPKKKKAGDDVILEDQSLNQKGANATTVVADLGSSQVTVAPSPEE